MNYLAHFLLGSGTEPRLVGSLLGDFVKGRIDSLPYRGELLAGIDLHRRIDSYTDSHPVTAVSRARFDPSRRRFAGIAVDLIYDHFLARHWRLFHAGALADFAQQCYQVLHKHRELLPPDCRRMAAYMAAEDWLANYAELARIDRSLRGIAARRPRFAPLAEFGPELERHYTALEDDFLVFFPELLEHLRNQPQ